MSDLIPSSLRLYIRTLDHRTMHLGPRGTAMLRSGRLSATASASSGGGKRRLYMYERPVQTTERYLGTKRDLVHAPNDGIKLRVAV